jgi:hypothetical protein
MSASELAEALSALAAARAAAVEREREIARICKSHSGVKRQ